MVPSRSETISGILIHSRPVGEHGFQSRLFTAAYGMISARGRGLLPEKARQADWSLRPGESGYRLQDFRYSGPVLVQRASACYFALYLNELLYRLAPFAVGDPDLYIAYSRSLVQLNYPEQQTLALRTFEQALLLSLGQSVDYQTDSGQQPIDPGRHYAFRALHGFDQDENSPVSGQQILAAGQLDMNYPGAISLARHCMGQQIAAMLTSGPLYSRQWPLINRGKNTS